MPLPSFEQLVAYSTKPRSEQINPVYTAVEKIARGALIGDYAFAESLTATKTLADSDNPILAYTASSAHQIVKLPPEASTNHSLAIYNAGGTYNLILQDDSGSTQYGVILPGQWMLCIPTGSVWMVRQMFAQKGYIDGLKLTWVSNTAIDIETGAAYIEGLNAVLQVNTKISLSGLSLSANSWYHAYLYSNSGSPAVELVTTAPASPFYGTARSKTSDSSRRYLGSVRTNASANIYNFLQVGNDVFYRDSQYASPFRCLNGGTQINETSVSLSAVVPATARMAMLFLFNTATNSGVYFGTSDDSNSGPPSTAIMQLGVSARVHAAFPVDSSQAVTYFYAATPTGGSASIDVYGYRFER